MISLDDSGPPDLGDRVIVAAPESHFLAQAGYVIGEDTTCTMLYGLRVVSAILESELVIQIAAESLIVSPYQDEEIDSA